MASGTTENRIREALTPCLEPGERLLVTGGFQSGGMWAELPKSTFFTIRNWEVGITDRRAILAKESRLKGTILQDGIFTVGRENVLVKGRTLRITSPDAKVPKVLKSLMGSGYDKDAFTKALSN